MNPRTNRPVGYAFVDLATAHEATAAIEELSGKEILQRKVSVQLARKPESAEAKAEGAVSGGEGASGTEGRKRAGGRARGRGRGRGRGGRFGRGGRVSLLHTSNGCPNALLTMRPTNQAQNGPATTEPPTNVPGQVDPLTEVANEAANATAPESGKQTGKPRAPRPQKQRGPPEDGIPSKTKVMVANLPYDLTEDKVRIFLNQPELGC